MLDRYDERMGNVELSHALKHDGMEVDKGNHCKVKQSNTPRMYGKANDIRMMVVLVPAPNQFKV